MQPTAIIPVKGFSVAKERLSSGFEPLDRALIATATAGRVVGSCVAAGCRAMVVTDDDAVAGLARDLGAIAIEDPGEGLDAAVSSGVARAPGPWIVLHADLPLVGAGIIERVAAGVSAGAYVIAPSRDGGTNLLGGPAGLAVAYGPGSFHRHLGRIGRTGYPFRVLVEEALAVEIDTPHDVEAAARRPGGRWLLPFLS